MMFKKYIFTAAIATLIPVAPVVSQGEYIKLTDPSTAQTIMLGMSINDKISENILTEEESSTTDNTAIESKKSKKKVKEDIPETIYDLYSENEVDILHKIVEAECTGQSSEAKQNVANVIINRVESDLFPNTIKDVVFQKSQFSPISDKRYWKVKVTKETKRACEKVFEEKDTTDGSLYFDCAKNSWASRNRTYVMTDDAGHNFYK